MNTAKWQNIAGSKKFFSQVRQVESNDTFYVFFPVNCHFDSVPQSPGASDDAVSCAIMLEVLEVITQSDTALKNTILFLFNGAEVKIDIS